MKPKKQRAIDLLIDRATEGLPPDLEAELGGLLAAFPELDPEPFELAAAAIELACTAAAAEPMPAQLSRRLTRQASELDRRPRFRRQAGQAPAYLRAE